MAQDNSGAGASGGIGFFGLLFIVFLVLKLCGVIDWSWWWVTAPLWGPFVFITFLICVVLIVKGICDR